MDVYVNHHVKCGAGYEAGEFCTSVYTKLKSDFCLNKKSGVPEEQWCYTSSTCDEPGVEIVDSFPKWRGGVAVKTCQSEDKLTNNLKPQMVNTIASNNGMRVDNLVKFTYKTSSDVWKDLSGAESTEVPTVFRDGKLVIGRAVYKMERTDINAFEGVTMTKFMKEKPTVRGEGYVCKKNCAR